MNTVLAVLGVIVAAVIVIALSIWWGKSRKRDLDRAMGKAAPDNKKIRDAKAAADARLAAEAEEAKAATAATAAEPVKSAESVKAESASAVQAEPEPAAAPKPEPQPASKPTPAKPETPESVGSRLTRLKAKLAESGNPFGKALFDILAKDNLSEADWEDVEDTLLLADVGADASAQLVDDLRTDARITGKADPAEVRATLKEKLLDLVGRDTDRRLNAEKPGAAKPSVIIMVGVSQYGPCDGAAGFRITHTGFGGCLTGFPSLGAANPRVYDGAFGDRILAGDLGCAIEGIKFIQTSQVLDGGGAQVHHFATDWRNDDALWQITLQLRFGSHAQRLVGCGHRYTSPGSACFGSRSSAEHILLDWVNAGNALDRKSVV